MDSKNVSVELNVKFISEEVTEIKVDGKIAGFLIQGSRGSFARISRSGTPVDTINSFDYMESVSAVVASYLR
jgi:hypothetical protein